MKSSLIVSTDPIADMLTRIRNAMAVNRREITLPHSRMKETVAKILVANGFLKDAKLVTEDDVKQLAIIINDESVSPAITEITRLSSPGRRVYVKAAEIPRIKRGRGIVVVSTSKGIMSGQEAASKKLGGELICRVY